MFVGIISDTHDQLSIVKKAVMLFRSRNVVAVIHCGDFIAPFSVKPFADAGCPFYAVYGNNDGEKNGLRRVIEGMGGEIHSGPHLFHISDKSILVKHEPFESYDLASCRVKPDYMLYGHTHCAVDNQECGIRTINPGEACGLLTGNPTAGILNLDTEGYEEICLNIL